MYADSASTCNPTRRQIISATVAIEVRKPTLKVLCLLNAGVDSVSVWTETLAVSGQGCYVIFIIQNDNAVLQHRPQSWLLTSACNLYLTQSFHQLAWQLPPPRRYPDQLTCQKLFELASVINIAGRYRHNNFTKLTAPGVGYVLVSIPKDFLSPHSILCII